MRWWYRWNQILSQVIFCALFRIRIINRGQVPLSGPVLLVSNHQSFLDPVLCGVGLHRELDYIARDSLFRNPLFAWLIRSLNAFPIQRDQADLGAIRTIIDRLRQGRAIVLFPEATRTRDGRIRTIKSGFDLIARKARATVVPVVIDGAFEAWPRTQPLFSTGNIKVLYGEAISPEQLRQLGRDELVTLINQRLRAMQTELRRRYGRRAFTYDAPSGD